MSAGNGLVALAERTMSFVGTEGYLPPEGPGTVPADLFRLGRVLDQHRERPSAVP